MFKIISLAKAKRKIKQARMETPPPAVTLSTKSHTILLSSSLAEETKKRKVEFLQVYFDKEDNKILFRPSEREAPGSLKISKNTTSTSKAISGVTVIKNLKLQNTVRTEVAWNPRHKGWIGTLTIQEEKTAQPEVKTE